jgi:hypothetical protein
MATPRSVENNIPENNRTNGEDCGDEGQLAKSSPELKGIPR